MASQAKSRAPPAQHKRRRKDAGPEKHGMSLGDQMEQSHEALPPKQRRPRKRRRQQAHDEYVTPVMSSKILSEARMQQLEIGNERDEETGVAATRRAFSAAVPDQRMDSDGDDEEGFSGTEELPEEVEEVPEEEERTMSMLMDSDAASQRTTAGTIVERFKDKCGDAMVVVGEGGGPTIPRPGIELLQRTGELLRRYRAGKLPLPLKMMPSLTKWEDALFYTEPERWSPNAMHKVTRVFVSNCKPRRAERFCNLVLLPRIRKDIRENKRLHFALYQAMKKTLYKPAAFYKGLLLPLCESKTCSLREAVIIGSVLQTVSIPVLHSSAAVATIAAMEFSGSNSYFLKLLLDKKYALPHRVLDSVVSHFARFTEGDGELPVIWHQSLLTFVQRYKNELSEEDKEKLRQLMRKHKHYLVTPEIQRELQHSRNRGEKEKNTSVGSAKIAKAVVEDDMRIPPQVGIGSDED